MLRFICRAVFAPLFIAVLLAFPAAADERPMGPDAKRELKGLVKVGEPLECLEGSRIDSEPLDQYRILFELRNKEKYLNELTGPGRCAGLDSNSSYSIQDKARSRKICKGGIVVVYARHGFGQTRCLLGMFYRLEPREAE